MTYDDSYAVTLPLRDWLSVQCAMYDAIGYNDDRGYNATAKDQRALLERVISNATRKALSLAHEELHRARALALAE